MKHSNIHRQLVSKILADVIIKFLDDDFARFGDDPKLFADFNLINNGMEPCELSNHVSECMQNQIRA